MEKKTRENAKHGGRGDFWLVLLVDVRRKHGDDDPTIIWTGYKLPTKVYLHRQI
jgi:hypothetical protein